LRNRLFLRLLAAFFIVMLLSTVTLDIFVRSAWERSLSAEIKAELTQKTQLFALLYEHNQLPLTQLVQQVSKQSAARATIIEAGGKVLADSEAEPERMENHAHRPEFVAALAGTPGSDMRTSKTVGIDFLYVAVPAKGGAVRLAYPLAIIKQSTAEIRKKIVAGSVIACLLAMFVAALMSRSSTRRIENMAAFAGRIADRDFSGALRDPSKDELGRLASSLDRTASMLQESFSELERSRTQLQTLLDSMQEAVIAVASDKRLMWANGAMRRLVPQTEREDVPLIEIIRDPALIQAVEASAKHKETQTVTTRALQPGRVFHVTVTPMARGGFVLVFHDITERERVEKIRRDFIANVSHELRTPLTAVQGYAQTLNEQVTDKTAKEYLEIIQKNSARMTRLTNDLLTLARVESGEQQLRLESSSASSLLQDALESQSAAAGQQGLELKITETTDEMVRCDSDTIQQVFSNLIENALKYGKAGGKIEIGARSAGSEAEFFVRDFGEGIPYEHHSRLFERFYRVDSARSRESGGTGLGLAIVKHIVQNHGGTVRVESELHHGATFYFTLPTATAVATPALLKN
jgi:two-component system, OmpR family, phosphate regulon sensor histidine kinase PhoR